MARDVFIDRHFGNMILCNILKLFHMYFFSAGKRKYIYIYIFYIYLRM